MSPMFWVWAFWFFMWFVAALVEVIADRRGSVRLANMALKAMWAFLFCMVTSCIALLVAI